MFSGCSSLTTAPVLPATTLVNNCYSNMFENCTSLNYIKAFFTTTPSSSYTNNWVSGVAPTGTFVKYVDATWDVVGNNGVPTGWLVQKGTYDEKDNPAYLTFYCDEAGTIGWKIYGDPSFAKTIQYSKDFGTTWTDITSTAEGATVSVSAGDIVWFKGSNSAYCEHGFFSGFTLSNKAHVYGNVNSLTGNNTSVSERCFYGLFLNCSNLYTYERKKIILPATTLANYCYSNMFYGCTSLTTAPELPATTLADGCYETMFMSCTSLNYIKALFTTTPGYGYTTYWVYGVAPTGTFVKSSAATWNVTGENGVPTGWTVMTE